MGQKIRTRFGKVDVHAAGDPSGERVLVVPGFSETIAHNRELVDELGELGFFAATVSQPRKSRSRVLGGSKRSALDRQADVLATILDRLNPDVKIHAVAHSMGAAAVLKVAQTRPERFASIILEQPLGFTSPQNKLEQIARVSHKIGRNQALALRGQTQKQPKVGYAALPDKESAARFSWRVGLAQAAASLMLGRNPILALRESKDCADYSALADLAAVKELGIPVYAVSAEGDEMFDFEEIDDSLSPEGADPLVIHSRVLDERAGHDTLWMQPKRSAEIIDTLVNPWLAKPLPSFTGTAQV